MNTAMQQLFEYFNNDELLPVNWQEKFLEKEKHQIIDARVDGVAKSLSIKNEIVDRNASAIYYEQTFKTL